MVSYPIAKTGGQLLDQGHHIAPISDVEPMGKICWPLAHAALGRGLELIEDQVFDSKGGTQRDKCLDLMLPRFQERCHPSRQYTRGLEDMTNASLQRGR
jgi:hypothetical protein